MGVKSNEELKARLSRLTQKSNMGQIPAPKIIEEPQVSASDKVKELEREFEEKKRALMEKEIEEIEETEEEPQVEIPKENDEGITKAKEVFSDEASFRLELIYQLVQMNTYLKSIAESLNFNKD